MKKGWKFAERGFGRGSLENGQMMSQEVTVIKGALVILGVKSIKEHQIDTITGGAEFQTEFETFGGVALIGAVSK
ncbi:MAG: hypothetical protein HDR86_02605 [Bacteroides sp.]|nr:hypothetical protein [Bacteroides sp.]